MAFIPQSDLLSGADEIAEFLFGDRKLRRRVYYLAEKGELPVFHLGAKLTARKSSLARRFEELEQAGKAGSDEEAA